MIKIKNLLFRSDYIRNVLTLITGTTISQIIPVACAPILSRIYQPQDFGVLALYMSIVMIAGVAATGRYEQSIILPENDNDSLNIVALSITLSAIVSTILFVLIKSFEKPVAGFYDNSKLLEWIYLIPLSVFLASVYQSCYYWFNRSKEYKLITISRIINSFVLIGSQLALCKITSNGLIFGYIIGQFSSVIFLTWKMLQRASHIQEPLSISYKNILKQAVRYIKFPKFLLVGHVLNTVSGNMPIFLLSSFFGGNISGFYSLTSRVIGLPMSLIGIATADVFRERASKDFLNYGHCDAIFVKTFKSLFLISLLPSAIFFLVSPSIFPILFGAEWATAGNYARLLTPMFLCQIVTTPLCSMFMIAEKQELDLAWQIVRMIFAVASICIGYYQFHDGSSSIFLFSISFSILYSASGVMAYKFSLGK
jgi:O-antigen/teichoic acid export membrane protein